ncbi:RdgB/HAM1 family non-canonical purine NTP pyrophosphatase [Candidatus Sumerlaeota bacterium]|nr:RdgB/HAM1 family non-canonical purine NTP pyrophosphatase [Candidatus Sumerlaeota bacterium]
MTDRTLLVGTNNAHKAREIAALLEDMNVRVATPREIGIDCEPVEDGATFRDNALLKARFYSRASGLPCLADDSGLEVDALDGRPGVLSSRYAPTDPERIQRLLDEMKNVEANRRAARFVCAAALVDARSETEIVEIGTCEGEIAFEPRGTNGFGYDPVFCLADVGQTMAELTPEEKNARSHRGRALRAVQPHIASLFS